MLTEENKMKKTGKMKRSESHQVIAIKKFNFSSETTKSPPGERGRHSNLSKTKNRERNSLSPSEVVKVAASPVLQPFEALKQPYSMSNKE